MSGDGRYIVQRYCYDGCDVLSQWDTMGRFDHKAMAIREAKLLGMRFPEGWVYVVTDRQTQIEIFRTK